MTDDDRTPAERAARELDLDHERVDYGTVASAEQAADAVGVPIERLAKTLVVRLDADDYVFVMIPGDRALDWPKVRTAVGRSRLSLPDAAEALAATGYERGAITPLGATTAWPVLIDERLLSHTTISIGSGRRGSALLVGPSALAAALGARTGDFTKDHFA